MTVDDEAFGPVNPGVELPDPLADEDYDEAEPEQSTVERLRAETRPPELLLWLDLETSGYVGRPHAATDTVLECAWMITYREPPTALRFRQPRMRHWSEPDTVDLTDWQLTPLRSRLCSIGPPPPPRPVRRGRVGPVVPSDDMRWAETPLVAKVVEMHDASGLTDDHIAAQLGDRIVGEPGTLTRLILDDVQAATAALRRAHEFDTYDRDPYLYLAGDGVGHYDQPLLSRGQFDLLSSRWHYRPEDISHAVHTFAPVRHPVQLLCAGNVAQEIGGVLAQGLDVDPRIDIGGWNGRETMQSWVSADEVAHRAAADVFRSVMAYLTARELIGSTLVTRQH